jgi:hypothetical protein
MNINIFQTSHDHQIACDYLRFLIFLEVYILKNRINTLNSFMSLRLILEKPVQEDFEYIFEEKDRRSPSTLYIKGPYMMAENFNRNNRMYKIDEMVKEVRRYTDEMIKTNRAMGTLNHESSAEVSLDKACHIVTELYQDGHVFHGKSKVLSTPCGHIVRSLVSDGVRVGMSSRALGQLEEAAGGKNIVKDLRLISIDCVADPSFPKAFVNGILESKQYVVSESGIFEQTYDSFERKLSNLPKKQVEQYLKESIMDFLNKIKLG